ncbi:ABC transporter ATP-binding protein [Paenibacillus wenxiniae]|uniref:ATP-binding cassette domain-containing protein n=1 Tax=Paenibacillus wenxiniae TaxID=1636843 RepID=A0ABW4RKJ9_9BACL
MLELDKLTVRSRQRVLVDEVSLSVGAGEWLALVGESGSGKSLLSQSIGGLLPAGIEASGSIRWNDQELMQLPARQLRQLRGKEIAYIFQDYQGAFTPFRTIAQHMNEYQSVHGEKDRQQRRQRNEQALESAGLSTKLLHRYPFQLSGGQLQRAAIALTLLLSPRLLIADEATTALDSVSGHRILELLRQKQQETGCAILFITHDWRHVRRYADRIAVMKEGKLVESGNRHRVLDHPRHPYTQQLIAAAPMLERSEPMLRSGLAPLERLEGQKS